VVVAGGSDVAARQLQGRVVLGIGLVFLAEQQLAAGVDEKRPEHVHHPVELTQQRRACADEDAAHDHRADDAPEQHPLLAAFGQPEVVEEH
jgi:hypothetical protein